MQEEGYGDVDGVPKSAKGASAGLYVKKMKREEE